MNQNAFDTADQETDAFLDTLALATLLGTLTDNPLTEAISTAALVIERQRETLQAFRLALKTAGDKLAGYVGGDVAKELLEALGEL